MIHCSKIRIILQEFNEICNCYIVKSWINFFVMFIWFINDASWPNRWCNNDLTTFILFIEHAHLMKRISWMLHLSFKITSIICYFIIVTYSSFVCLKKKESNLRQYKCSWLIVSIGRHQFWTRSLLFLLTLKISLFFSIKRSELL